MLIAVAESELGVSVATHTHLGNANNLLCHEAEKSAYKTCVSRTSSPRQDSESMTKARMQENPFIAVRWVKVGGSHSPLGFGESWGILGQGRSLVFGCVSLVAEDG